MADVEQPAEVPQVDEVTGDSLPRDAAATGAETETEKEPADDGANGVKKETVKENVPPKRPGAAAPARRMWST